MEFFGAEVWAARPDELRCTTDYLCGNHTRNLPVAAFNRLFDEWLAEVLGDAFAACSAASGGRSRLEKSGTALLRSICKLVSRGWGAYPKGDGGEFHDALVADADEFADESVGRAELSKRQDWPLEASWKLFPLLNPILKYTDSTRRLDANVLRDSVCQRVELLHFQAYIHGGAVMWGVCWEELRALTNSKSVELDPLQLNVIYDELWKVGTLLQSEAAFDIFLADYRPWDAVEGLTTWYARRRVCALSKKRRELLRAYDSREDAAEFTPLLKKVLALLGAGIHESLKRTMGDYLEATNGCHAQSKLEPWMKARVVHLLSHNNAAERPFAVVKLFDHLFPTMALSNLSNLSHARVNGTFALAPPKPKTLKGASKAGQKPAGAAILADPRLQQGVSKVSGVRKSSLGAVIKLRREQRAADETAAVAHRKAHRADLLAEHTQQAAGRAQKKDTAHSIELLTSVEELRVHLVAKTGKGARMMLVSRQFDARVTGRATLFVYSQAAIGARYRVVAQKAKPLKKSPSDDEDSLVYLTRLVELMIADDVKEGRYAAAHLEEAQAAEVTIARELPVISEAHTSAYSRALKEKAKAEAKALMDVEDDPVLVELVDKYVDAVLLDEEDGETYVVRAVQYDERGDSKYYEATCVRVEKGEGGSWAVPPSSFVAGSEVLKDGLLVGYALMDLTDPGDPELLSDVDEMISAHSARETTVQEDEGGSKKRKTGRGKGGSKLKQPRARAAKAAK